MKYNIEDLLNKNILMENEVLETTENEVVEDGQSTGEVDNTIETTEEPIIEETTEEPTKVEETEEEPTIEETEEEIEVNDKILDDILSELDTTETEEEELITEPSFFNDEKDEITEEDLEVIDNTLGELEQSLSELEETNKALLAEKEELQENEQKVSEALDKLGEHPILGPLNEKLLKGEEVNIPEYLKEKLNEEKASIPDMNDIVNEPAAPQGEASLEDLLVSTSRGQLDFLKKI